MIVVVFVVFGIVILNVVVNLLLVMDKEKEREVKEKLRRDIRVVKMFFIVMGIFMFCWVLYFIGMICLFFLSCKWLDEFFVIIIWLVMLNSGCNLIIYGVMNKKF